MGFCEVLTIVFVVLKLLGIIEWAWVLVFLPEIIAGVFYIAIIVFQIVAHVKVHKLNKEFDKKMKGW